MNCKRQRAIIEPIAPCAFTSSSECINRMSKSKRKTFFFSRSFLHKIEWKCRETNKQNRKTEAKMLFKTKQTVFKPEPFAADAKRTFK